MMNSVAARTAVPALIVGGIALLGAACGDISGSTGRFDPRPTLERLDEVLAPFESAGDFLLGLDLAVATLELYGSATMAAGIALRPAGDHALLHSLRRVHRRRGDLSGDVRSGGGGTEGAAGAFTVPWAVMGETLVWDRNEGYVVSGRGGAPSNGVRLLLYRMDDETGYPVEPLSQVGYLDITDEDRAAEEAVRVRAVRTAGPERVLADYRVALTGQGSYDEGRMDVTTRGALGEGNAVELDLSQRLAWSRSRDRDELTLDYEYRRGSRSVQLEGRAESRFEALDWESFAFDLSFRGGSVATEIEAHVRRDGSLDGEIRDGGRRVVRIGGYEGRPTFESLAGTGLGPSERTTLELTWTGIADLLWLTEWAAVPADLLLADG